jgi:hypothetical protein
MEVSRCRWSIELVNNNKENNNDLAYRSIWGSYKKLVSRMGAVHLDIYLGR